MPIAVSIIIVTYHAEKTLENCINSVLKQSLNAIELIIIDGQSTDATCQIISKYTDHIAYWVSEADKGIYHAMNKGLDHATGEWILFLGADDQIYDPDTLSSILGQVHKPCDLIAGNIIYDTGAHFRPNFNWQIYFKNTLHHQGVLYHRSVFSNYRYNPKHKISGDYELNLRLYLNDAKHLLIPQTISTCAAMGASHQVSPVGYEEEIEIRNRLINIHPFLLKLLSMITKIRFNLKQWQSRQ